MARFLGVDIGGSVRVFVRDQSGKALEVSRRKQSAFETYSAILFSLDNGRDHLRMKKDRGVQRIEDLAKPPYSIRVVIRTNKTMEFVIDPRKLRRIVR